MCVIILVGCLRVGLFGISCFGGCLFCFRVGLRARYGKMVGSVAVYLT